LNEARLEWKRHRTLVAASMFGFSTSALHLYSGGLLMAPLEEQFGWSRSMITSGLLLISIVGVIGAPFIGRIIDRVGPRRIALPGMALYLCAFAMVGLNQGSAWQWYGSMALLASGSLLLKPTVWALAVTTVFTKARGLALAITQTGTSVTGVVVPLLVAALLSAFGWRGAYIGLAAIWLVIVFPFVFWKFRTSLDRAPASQPARASPPSPGRSSREEMRSPVFFKLVSISLLMVLVTTALLFHLVPMLTEMGVSRTTAAQMATLIGITSIVGRLTGGLLLDHFPATLVGAVIFLLPAMASVLLLWAVPSMTVCITAVVMIGLALGAEIDVLSYMASRHFSLGNFGLLFGTMAGFMSLGSGLGPTIGGVIHDRFGDYEYLLAGTIPLVLMSVILCVTTGNKPAAVSSRP